MSAEQQVPVITIDGPSGSGKGTLAQLVAEDLGWHLLDSGALYRIVGAMCVRREIAFAAVDDVAEEGGTQPGKGHLGTKTG